MNLTEDITQIVKKLESYQTMTENPETKKAIMLLVRDLYCIAFDVTLLQSDPKQVVKRRGKKGLFNL